MSNFSGSAPDSSVFMPPPGIGEDPDMIGRYLGHIAESFHKRDRGMASLTALLSQYSDTLVMTPGGGGAIALARPAGDGAAAGAHPWQVIPNGDDTVTITKGKAMGFRSVSASVAGPSHAAFASYGGESSRSVSEAGYFYLVATCDIVMIDPSHTDMGTLAGVTPSPYTPAIHSHYPTSVRVEFSATAPDSIDEAVANELWVPIAQVGLADGVASVVDQILTHNPLLAVEVIRFG